MPECFFHRTSSLLKVAISAVLEDDGFTRPQSLSAQNVLMSATCLPGSQHTQVIECLSAPPSVDLHTLENGVPPAMQWESMLGHIWQ